MRLVSLFAIMILAASCGQNGGGGSSSSSSNGGNGSCNLNGRNVACESIRGADGLGVDLLESMVEVPVQVSASDITFMADKTATAEGRRITCPTSVKSGETYRYSLRGDSELYVSASTGNYVYSRISSGNGLIGTWAWKGYKDQGTHLIKTMTFLSNTKMIMRTSCEL